MSSNSLIAEGATAFGGAFGSCLTYVLGRRQRVAKQKAELIDTVQRAAHEMIQDLRQEVADMRPALAECKESHDECKGELGDLKRRSADMQAQIDRLMEEDVPPYRPGLAARPARPRKPKP